jgi:hypothetical protein
MPSTIKIGPQEQGETTGFLSHGKTGKNVTYAKFHLKGLALANKTRHNKVRQCLPARTIRQNITACTRTCHSKQRGYPYIRERRTVLHTPAPSTTNQESSPHMPHSITVFTYHSNRNSQTKGVNTHPAVTTILSTLTDISVFNLRHFAEQNGFNSFNLQQNYDFHYINFRHMALDSCCLSSTMSHLPLLMAGVELCREQISRCNTMSFTPVAYR